MVQRRRRSRPRIRSIFARRPDYSKLEVPEDAPEADPNETEATSADPDAVEDESEVDPDLDSADDGPWHARLRRKAAASGALDRVLHGAKTALEVGSDAADILADLGRDGLTGPGAAALGLRTVNTLRELRSRSPESHFAEGWKPLPLHGMETLLHAAFSANLEVHPRPVAGMYDHSPAYTAELSGIEFGWAVSQLPRGSGGLRSRGWADEGASSVQGTWVRVDQDQAVALQVLGRCVWTHLSSLSLLARNVRQGGLSFVPDPNDEILPSRTGQHLYESRLQPALKRGINRSAFLIGDPGIGKSCMLRYIASLHGGLQLRFKLADLHGLSGSEISQVVEILRPDVLMIDDFDRFVGADDRRNRSSPEATGMLDPLERINALVPLFIVSANYSEGITPALLRPGRFDEIIVMDVLEPEIYAKMLPGAPEKMIAAIQRSRMPMSHVVELRKRAEAADWDWDAARKELRDLANRSDVVVQLNKRKTKKPRKKPKLAGKTQRQKAHMLERRALRQERHAQKLIEQSEKAKEGAETSRLQAAEWRNKAQAAESADAKKKAAKKTAPKKAKKATRGKSTKRRPRAAKAKATDTDQSSESQKGTDTP